MSCEDLSTWIPLGGCANGKEYDVIAIGMQESTFKVEKSDKRAVARFQADHSSPDSPNPLIAAILERRPAGDSAATIGPDELDELYGNDDDADDDADAGADDDAGDEGHPASPEESEESGGGGGGGNKKPGPKVTGGWKAVAKDIVTQRCSRYLKKSLQAVLGSSYVLVQQAQALQMRLLVFVHEHHPVDHTAVQVKTESTGLGSVVANKGGQAIKLTVAGMSLCFVSSHLAAHEGEKNLLDRNKSIATIMQGSRLGNKWLDLSSQFDHCFFMGDLNYRVDLSKVDRFAHLFPANLPAGAAAAVGARPRWTEEEKRQQHAIRHQAVLELVGGLDSVEPATRRQALALLMQADELTTSLERGDALLGFREVGGGPTFHPTFKVLRDAAEEWVPSPNTRPNRRQHPALVEDPSRYRQHPFHIPCPRSNVPWCSVVQRDAAWCSVVQRGVAWCSMACQLLQRRSLQPTSPPLCARHLAGATASWLLVSILGGDCTRTPLVTALLLHL
jgi:hypothetical protein